MVCTKTLYKYIDQQLLNVRNIDLLLKTRRKPKKNVSRCHKRLQGKSISERPENVDNREEFDHWEIDTVIGKRSGDQALLTITERQTRHHLILRLKSKTTQAVDKALNNLKDRYEDLFEQVFKTITAYNGTEFSKLNNHEFDVYFAHPYSAWERGTNEHHNGLIRRFIPKGKPIEQLTNSQIQRVESWCNNLPRKILSYHTPAELFARDIQRLRETKVVVA